MLGRVRQELDKCEIRVKLCYKGGWTRRSCWEGRDKSKIIVR